MTITVFVNWRNEDICSEKQKEEKIKEIAADKEDESLQFFLEDDKGYSVTDVFSMTDKDKECLKEEYSKFCYELAEADFMDDYEEVELEA